MSTSHVTVRVGELRRRADVHYWTSREVEAADNDAPRFPTSLLKDLVVDIQYGSSARAEGRGDVPILRMTNIRDGAIDFTDMKFVSLSTPEVSRYRLDDGDILLVRTNGSRDLVGRCAVFRGTSEHVFASYLLRIRPKSSDLDPDFLSEFLNGAAGRAQLLRKSRQIMMSNINTEELRSVVLPVPSVSAQRSIAGPLVQARSNRRTAVREADLVERHVADRAQEHLGVVEAGIPHGPISVRRSAMAGRRMDVAAYHPERLAAARAIEGSPGGGVRLGALAAIVSEPPLASEEPHLGLSAVQQESGLLVEDHPDEEVAGAQGFRAGDILYSRLRPRLVKVWVADRDGSCSTEFRVLRLLPGSKDRPDFVGLALRMPAVARQLVHLASGNTHPRVSDVDLLDVLIPRATRAAQWEAVRMQQAERRKAQQVRSDADTALRFAENRFQRELFGHEGGEGGRDS